MSLRRDDFDAIIHILRIVGYDATANAVVDSAYAYNAHRPASPTPDAEAIAREALDAMNKAECATGRYGEEAWIEQSAVPIIADAIRKGRGE